MPKILPGETDIYAITDPNYSLGAPWKKWSAPCSAPVCASCSTAKKSSKPEPCWKNAACSAA